MLFYVSHVNKQRERLEQTIIKQHDTMMYQQQVIQTLGAHVQQMAHEKHNTPAYPGFPFN
jgi:hypothetical protein